MSLLPAEPLLQAPEPPPAVAPCRNCGGSLVEHFCASCGQPVPKPEDYSIRELALAGLEEFTDYDARLWRTVRALFLHPGLLAREHFEGRRARYFSSFKLFVYTNVAAWLVIPFVNIVGFSLEYAQKAVLFPEFWNRALTARAAFAKVSVEAFSERIHKLGSAEDAATVLCMVPLLAIATHVALLGRGYRYVQHLVFSAHIFCVHLLGVVFVIGATFTVLVAWLKANPTSPITPPLLGTLRSLWVQHFLVWPLLFPYVVVAVRRAYVLTTGESLWRAVLIATAACTLGRVFFDLAFALVLIFA